MPDFNAEYKWDQLPLSSVIATYCLGIFFWTGLSFSYDLFTLTAYIFNVLFRYTPMLPPCLRPDPLDYELWRPMFRPHPYLATSLSEFWSQQWHILFLRSVTVCGVWPTRKLLTPIFGKRLAGTAGVFAAFFISGLIHEYGMFFLKIFFLYRLCINILFNLGVIRSTPEELAGRPYLTIIFFCIHGLIVLLESLFTRITRIRVGGFVGWLWATTVLICSGHLLLEPW